MSKRWTQDEDIEFKNMYRIHNTEYLMNYFKRSKDSIIHHASVLGIKKGFDFHRRSDASVLLNGSLTSLYWIGFLLADGTFPNANGNVTSQLTLLLAERDAEHLQKFADYIQLGRPIKRREFKTNKVDKFVGYEVTIGDSDRLPKLCKAFDIVSNKTVNAPNFSLYEISTEQWISLFIGLLDGDGYITNKNQKIHARIKCHLSWGDSYQFVSSKITSWANVKPISVYYQGTCCMLTIGKRVLLPLHNFALKNHLPILSRKWDIL